MRKIPRTGPVPAALLPGSRGETETRQAKEHYEEKTRPKPPNWTAYRDPSVQERLHEIFAGKCSYCETKVGAARADQVEHWRPKKRIDDVAGGTVRDTGYYWAAARWANLFLSCGGCNGSKHQLDAAIMSERLLGKGNRFPLEPGTNWATDEPGEAHEKPLLLDPTADEPSEHLELWELEGRAALLRPRNGSPKGQASIEVYGLNRLRLWDERQALHAELVRQLNSIEQLIQKRDAFKAEGRDTTGYDDGIASNIETLAKYLEPSAQYLFMAARVIIPELKRLGLNPPEPV
jgi:5-methylcytosine-specific restriction endonuclease McrA